MKLFQRALIFVLVAASLAVAQPPNEWSNEKYRGIQPNIAAVKAQPVNNTDEPIKYFVRDMQKFVVWDKAATSGEAADDGSTGFWVEAGGDSVAAAEWVGTRNNPAANLICTELEIVVDGSAAAVDAWAGLNSGSTVLGLWVAIDIGPTEFMHYWTAQVPSAINLATIGDVILQQYVDSLESAPVPGGGFIEVTDSVSLGDGSFRIKFNLCGTAAVAGVNGGAFTDPALATANLSFSDNAANPGFHPYEQGSSSLPTGVTQPTKPATLQVYRYRNPDGTFKRVGVADPINFAWPADGDFTPNEWAGDGTEAGSLAAMQTALPDVPAARNAASVRIPSTFQVPDKVNAYDPTTPTVNLPAVEPHWQEDDVVVLRYTNGVLLTKVVDNAGTLELLSTPADPDYLFTEPAGGKTIAKTAAGANVVHNAAAVDAINALPNSGTTFVEPAGSRTTVAVAMPAFSGTDTGFITIISNPVEVTMSLPVGAAYSATQVINGEEGVPVFFENTQASTQVVAFKVPGVYSHVAGIASSSSNDVEMHIAIKVKDHMAGATISHDGMSADVICGTPDSSLETLDAEWTHHEIPAGAKANVTFPLLLADTKYAALSLDGTDLGAATITLPAGTTWYDGLANDKTEVYLTKTKYATSVYRDGNLIRPLDPDSVAKATELECFSKPPTSEQLNDSTNYTVLTVTSAEDDGSPGTLRTLWEGAPANSIIQVDPSVGIITLRKPLRFVGKDDIWFAPVQPVTVHGSIQLVSCNRVYVGNVRWRSMMQIAAPNGRDAVNLQLCNSVTFQNCTMNFGQDQTLGFTGCNDCWFDSCQISLCARGVGPLAYQNLNTWMTNCFISNHNFRPVFGNNSGTLISTVHFCNNVIYNQDTFLQMGVGFTGDVTDNIAQQGPTRTFGLNYFFTPAGQPASLFFDGTNQVFDVAGTQLATGWTATSGARNVPLTDPCAMQAKLSTGRVPGTKFHDAFEARLWLDYQNRTQTVFRETNIPTGAWDVVPMSSIYNRDGTLSTPVTTLVDLGDAGNTSAGLTWVPSGSFNRNNTFSGFNHDLRLNANSAVNITLPGTGVFSVDMMDVDEPGGAVTITSDQIITALVKAEANAGDLVIVGSGTNSVTVTGAPAAANSVVNQVSFTFSESATSAVFTVPASVQAVGLNFGQVEALPYHSWLNFEKQIDINVAGGVIPFELLRAVAADGVSPIPAGTTVDLEVSGTDGVWHDVRTGMDLTNIGSGVAGPESAILVGWNISGGGTITIDTNNAVVTPISTANGTWIRTTLNTPGETPRPQIAFYQNAL